MSSTTHAEEAADKVICVMGDEDTVTGFLLAGVGQRDAKGANFLVVDASAYYNIHRGWYYYCEWRY
jgi:hypothetical protein